MLTAANTMIIDKKIWCRSVIGLAKVLVLVFMSASSAFAALERYDYDPIGRLVRVIDEQDRVTEYVYDAAGNILKVDTGGNGSALAPTISSISPSSMRRGQTQTAFITGQNLAIGDLSASDADIQISDVTRSATQLTFTLAIGPSAVLGSSKLNFTSAAGKAEVDLTINPLLPKVTVEPNPLAIPPDNVARQFTVKLSHADGIPHTLNLVSGNTSIVTVGTASVTIAAGETTAHVTVTGKAAGSAAIAITSPTLAPTSVPVYVTGEFLGLSTSFARPLGVVLEAEPAPDAGTGSSVSARPLGVSVGSYLHQAAPQNLLVGTETALVISGAEIPADAAVAVTPADGLTLGAASIATDGKTLSVPVTVAPDAPTTIRGITVTSGGQALPWSAPEARMIRVAYPPATLFSVEPFFAAPGQTLMLKLRGSNLHDASRIDFHPTAGLITEAPNVNADGTELTARVQITFDAKPGSHVVTVTTPGGTSSAVAEPANTFVVVEEIGNVYAPIASPLLGVVVETDAPPAATSTTTTGVLGVVFGPAATSTAPEVALINETTTLTVGGTGLHGVTEARVIPDTGITLGTLSISPDGTFVTFPISVALDAPQTRRAVELRAGAELLSFLNPEEALFQVSAPPPVLESVSPNVAKIGSEATLKIRGKDLHAAQGVRLEPAQGATFTAVQANAAGTELTATMILAADAQPGERAVVVTTNGGDSTLSMSPANTITLAEDPGPTITPVTSQALGVVVETPVSEIPIASETVSAALGVVVQDDTPSPTVASSTISPRIGVVVGSAITAIAPNGFNRGTSGTLNIYGDGLGEVTAVAILPEAGISLGTPTVAAAGNQVSVPITIAPDAVADSYRLSVSGANGTIEFADPAVNQVHVGLGTPQLVSIAPILAPQGDTLTLTLRGTNLRTASAIVAEPPQGIVFASGGPEWSSDALGEKLTVKFHVPADAALGARVIRVVSPGTISSAEPMPANTLTVIAP